MSTSMRCCELRALADSSDSRRLRVRGALGWLVSLGTFAVVVAGCAAVSGLDELQKVACTEDCGAGGNGNEFDLKCTSQKQCGMTDSCCGHVNGPSQYSSACEPVANCVMTNGVRLCADSEDCGGTAWYPLCDPRPSA